MLRHVVAIAVALLLAVAARADDTDANKDRQRIQGVWQLVKYETPPDHRPPPEFVAKMQLILAEDKLAVRVGDKMVEQTNFRLDPSKNPKWFDTVVTQGPNKGKISEGIYELNGDELKICNGPPGQNRPTEFKWTRDAHTMTGVMFFKRAKR